MSNPAVVKLSKKTINKSKVWLDDNFGESIHIHIDDFRTDITIKEFEQLCHDVGEAVNSLIAVDGFDCNNLDPVYFEIALWKRLMNLKSVKIDEAALGSMWAPGKVGIFPLPESRAVRALRGDSKENDEPRYSHHIGQTSQNRLDSMKKSIQENGYPSNDQYIVLYGDDNIIRDGQHRAACLYSLYGDKKVPVMRMYFDNYKPENISITRNRLYRAINKKVLIIKNIRDMESLFSTILSFINTKKTEYRTRKIKRYKQKNKKELERLSEIISRR